MATTTRLEAIVRSLTLKPAAEVLEIGCGHGVAAALICAMLRTGHYCGIDRSAKMIAAASRKNRDAVTSGIARFELAALEEFDPGSRRFDVILAVRVGAFRGPKGAAVRARVERWLRPGGRLVVVLDSPPPRR